MLLITHEAPSAAYADRVVRLRDGEVVSVDDDVTATYYPRRIARRVPIIEALRFE